MRIAIAATLVALYCSSLHATPVSYAFSGGAGDARVPGTNITVNVAESDSDTQTDGSTAIADYVEPFAMVHTRASLGTINISAEAVRTPSANTSSGLYVQGDDAGGRGYYIDDFVISGGSGQGTASIGVIVDGGIRATDPHDPGKFSGGVSMFVNQDPDGANTPVIYPGMPVNPNPAFNGALAGQLPVPATETFFGAYPTPTLVVLGAIGDFTFVYDVPFTLKVEVAVSAFLDTAEASSAVTMDFFNTANTLFSLPEGATLAALSGVSYDVIGTQNPNDDPTGDPGGAGVPLPAVMPLLVIGVLGLGLARCPCRDRRRQHDVNA